MFAGLHNVHAITFDDEKNNGSYTYSLQWYPCHCYTKTMIIFKRKRKGLYFFEIEHRAIIRNAKQPNVVKSKYIYLKNWKNAA